MTMAAEDRLDDTIEALEAIHGADDEDLHFRFIGKAKRRTFVVNVQFDRADDRTKERLRPEEYDFMIGNVLALILNRLGETPNRALH